MDYEKLYIIAHALGEQAYSAVVDWNNRGNPANRAKALRKLEKLASQAGQAAREAAKPAYEGPIHVDRGSHHDL